MSHAKVYAILIGVMILWGINTPWMKIIIASGDPLTLQATRVFIASLVIFIILKCFRKKLIVANMPWKYIWLGAFFGVMLHHGFYAFGIDQTTAMKAGIINGLSPLFTAMAAVIFKDTVMTRTKLLGFMLGFSGILVAIVKGWDDLFAWEIGDLYIFLSFFLQSFSFIAIRRATKVIQPMLMTAWMQFVGSLVLVALAFSIQPSNFSVFATMPSNVFIIFLLSGIVATGIGHTLYNLCIQQIGAAESAIFSNFNTIFSLIASALILHEVLTVQQFIGCLLVVLGVLTGTGNMERFIRWRRTAKQ